MKQAIDETVVRIIALRNWKENNHKCGWCEHLRNIPYDEIGNTTVDVNSCPFAASLMYEDCQIGQTGNDRKYPCGFETADNGGGYWIIHCPNFRRMDDRFLYRDYLKTAKWKNTARQRMTLDGFKCQMCGTGKNLVVHHITYDRLGCEDMNDLVTVCKSCHEKIHSEDLKGKAHGKA